MEWALRKRGVTERLVGAVMRLYDGTITELKVGNGLAEGFTVEVGIVSSVCA